MEKLESKIEQQTKPEALKTPEIVVQEENGAQLLSLILKAKNIEWGNSNDPISEEAKVYFQENPLNQNISEFLDSIRAL